MLQGEFEMSDVISFLTSLLLIACLIYVPICAIVVLARSLATPGDGKMTKEDERFGKLFSWHYLFWAVIDKVSLDIVN